MRMSRQILSPKVSKTGEGHMVTNEVCIEVTSRTLRQRYGDMRHAAKTMARRHGWSLKAVHNWFYGHNAPRMQDLITLMADCPELEREVARMVEETRKCLQD